jgi:hypothetical protein
MKLLFLYSNKTYKGRFTMRKEASIEQWRELYEVTMHLKSLHPWGYFSK